MKRVSNRKVFRISDAQSQAAARKAGVGIEVPFRRTPRPAVAGNLWVSTSQVNVEAVCAEPGGCVRWMNALADMRTLDGLFLRSAHPSTNDSWPVCSETERAPQATVVLSSIFAGIVHLLEYMCIFSQFSEFRIFSIQKSSIFAVCVFSVRSHILRARMH